MAQLNIYVSDSFAERLSKIAKKNKVSLSKWVSRILEKELQDKWPEDYFDIFSSKSKIDFDRPKEGFFSDDIKREKL